MSGTYRIKYSDYTTANQHEILIHPMVKYPPPRSTPPASTDGQFPLVFAGYRYPEYGEAIWTNFLHLLENFANATPPEGAVVGQLWFNKSTGAYQFFGTDKDWHDIGSQSVSTAVAPIASFTKSTASGVAPLSVTFTDTSTNTPTSWLWNFGDDTTSTVQNPTKSYASPSTYNVTLTATNSAGSSTSATQVVTASASIVAPVASFAKSATSGVIPLNITFTDTSTNTPTTWLWTFGDGSTATTQNASHAYTSAGTYSVTLRATNSAGSHTSSAQVITVTTATTVYDEVFTAPTTVTTGTPFTISITGAEPNSVITGNGYLNGSTVPSPWGPFTVNSNGSLDITANHAPNGTQGTWVQTVTFSTGHTRSRTITATCVEPGQIVDTISNVGTFGSQQVTYSNGYVRSSPLLLSTTNPTVSTINGWYTSTSARPADQTGVLALLSLYNSSGAERARAEFDGWVSASRVTPGAELYNVTVSSVKTFCAQAATGVAYAAQFATTSVNEGGTITCTFRTAGIPAGTTFGYIVYGTQAPPMLAASNADFAAYTGTFTTNTSETGTFTITVQNDGVVEAVELFYVDITRNGTTVAGTNVVKINSVLSAPVGAAWPATTGVRGSPVDAQWGTTYFTAPSGDPLVITATGLPSGLTISTTGHITGTMTTAGSYYPIIKATGLTGLTATMTGLWLVQP